MFALLNVPASDDMREFGECLGRDSKPVALVA